MSSLYVQNSPQAFWRPLTPIASNAWAQAALDCLAILPARVRADVAAGGDVGELILGEGQFGERRWRLSPARRLYYDVKPLLPRPLTRLLRKAAARRDNGQFLLGWPAEDRYVLFLQATFLRALELANYESGEHIDFWPYGRQTALVLTHDVETAAGQRFIPRIADLEEKLGFRSSFNFVPERYSLDRVLIDELRRRGFEIGVHGLKHDGKLFRSRAEFERRAARINWWLHELDAVGFRAPLTHRNAEWMQALDIDYDLSFFDTDPYEPMPGGVMSVWPFQVGRFIELPYTLIQDYTLSAILGERTPRIWLEKLRLIERWRGMALLNSHPDYLRDPALLAMYENFLRSLAADRNRHWHALPSEVSWWWRLRSRQRRPEGLPGATVRSISILDPPWLPERSASQFDPVAAATS